MKKLYFLAAAALMLAGCANEEVFEASQAQNEITFTALTKNASRGAVTTATGYAAPFYVASAYQAEVGGTYSNIFGTSPEFDFVKYTLGGTIWTSSNEYTYYYPKNGQIDFFAYATGTPASAGGDDEVLPVATLNRATDGDKGITSMVLNYKGANKLQGKTDVMYALKPGVTCPQSDKVTLPFKHALAWATLSISESANRVKIVSATLDNVYLTGEVTIPVNNHVVGDPTWTVNTTDLQSNVPFTTFCPATPTLVSGLTDAATGILLVPGVMTSGKQTSITLKYVMTENPDVVITNVIDISELPDWQAGYLYKYNIVIGLQAIEFDCDVTPYNDYDMSGNFDNGQIKL